jgi:hypothetical protein
MAGPYIFSTESNSTLRRIDLSSNVENFILDGGIPAGGGIAWDATQGIGYGVTGSDNRLRSLSGLNLGIIYVFPNIGADAYSIGAFDISPTTGKALFGTGLSFLPWTGIQTVDIRPGPSFGTRGPDITLISDNAVVDVCGGVWADRNSSLAVAFGVNDIISDEGCCYILNVQTNVVLNRFRLAVISQVMYMGTTIYVMGANGVGHRILKRFNSSTGALISSVDLGAGGNPQSAVITEDESKIFMSSLINTGENIDVINPITGALITSVSVIAGPAIILGFCWDSDNDRVLVHVSTGGLKAMNQTTYALTPISLTGDTLIGSSSDILVFAPFNPTLNTSNYSWTSSPIMTLFSLQGTSSSEAKLPIAVFSADPEFGVLGSVIKLNGFASKDPDGLPLTYIWEFIDGSIPIGSMVIQEGFKTFESDGSVVMFSPDKVGEYIVGLKVSNGIFTSAQVTQRISIRAITVPHGRGLVPDGKFIWSYIRDVWTEVENKEWFETLWSVLIQITGTEMLKLYQTDFNKSIKDIQDLYQRRWIAYESKLDLVEDDLSFYIGTHFAGTDASTNKLGLVGQGIIINSSEIIITEGTVLPFAINQTLKILYSSNTSNIASYIILSPNSSKTGYKLASTIPNITADKPATAIRFYFTFQSTTWTNVDSASVVIGDMINFNGPNAGLYRVLGVSGGTVTVDKVPPASSDATSSVAYKADVYRPVGISVTQPSQETINSFYFQYSASKDITSIVPGRLAVVGGRSFPIQKVFLNNNQLFPLSIVTSTDSSIPSGLSSLNWRTPHTLVSKTQNFEDLGVSSGDLLVVDVVNKDTGTAASINVQVVGVYQNSIGVVLTDSSVQAGTVPNIPNSTYTTLAQDFNIPGVAESNGVLTLSSTALEMDTLVKSLFFNRTYHNKELTPFSDIEVNDFVFNLKPKYIIRNTKVLVDSDLKSIPVLQEYIKQPDIAIHDDKIFQIKGEKEYEVPALPSVLFENSDYIIDDENAMSGIFTFKTGSASLVIEGASFIDKHISAGDTLIIEEPSFVADSYVVKNVTGVDSLLLTSPISEYTPGIDSYVTAKIRLVRRKASKYIRFVPGGFTANNPAPSRLWAEVSFFDNAPNIEKNFGVMVGVTRDDLEGFTSNIGYRQVVAGLMYALTKGSALDKVRLGTQILVGLPFTEHRGIVRSIEPDYRLDSSGKIIAGRILIEDVDANNEGLGVSRIYIYPVDIDSSDFSGLDLNPSTGDVYKVGGLGGGVCSIEQRN